MKGLVVPNVGASLDKCSLAAPFLFYSPLGSPVQACGRLSNLERLRLHGSIHEAAEVGDQSGGPNQGLVDQGEGHLGN